MADAALKQISQGCLEAIFSDPERARQTYPVPILQCLQVKTLENNSGDGKPERFRVVFSDVKHYVQCMLATQANHVVHDKQLDKGSIVRIKSFQSNVVKGKNIMIILDLEVIDSFGRIDKIGEPAPMAFKDQEAPQNTTIGGSGFYGKQEVKTEPQKQLPTRANGGGSRGMTDHGNNVIYPIEALSPYAHKWTIKARVSSKSDIKTWHKASGEGKLFSVNFLDESGEIKATGFNDQVDQFYDLFQEGAVYYISNPCRVNLAKKQFSNLPNDYELTFERDTVIEKAEDQTNVPQVRFNFCNIQELQDVEKDSTVDVVGILKDVGEVSEITAKNSGKPYSKRELTLVDDSSFSVRLTIWGKTATDFDASPESVVAFKGVKVSDFGGRSLSLLSSGTMSIDPDIAEAHKLKGWYDASGKSDNFATHNNMAMGAATGRKEELKSVFDVKEEQLGMENQDYFTLKATIVYIKQDSFAYPACGNTKDGKICNKKVVEEDGGWRCENCSITHERPTYRYIMSVNVNDHTGQLWLSCFDEVGKIIMGGKSADDLMAYKESDEKQAAAEFELANCRKLSFRCRAKMDTFGDTQRVRYQVMSANTMDWKNEANKLADLIKAYGV